MCYMNILFRLILPVCLAFLLIAGQGTVLAESLCCIELPQQEQEHRCCPKIKKHQHSHHDNKRFETTFKHTGCQMQHATVDLYLDKPFHIQLNPETLVLSSFANLIQGLQYAAYRKPIWLYRLFYPDKSELYIEQQHLLL